MQGSAHRLAEVLDAIRPPPFFMGNKPCGSLVSRGSTDARSRISIIAPIDFIAGFQMAFCHPNIFPEKDNLAKTIELSSFFWLSKGGG